MEKNDIEYLKKKLEEERVLVEKELSSIGERNPSNINDWEATPERGVEAATDPNETATTIEEFEENTAILKQLEIRYNEIVDALKRIENGTYGKCEKGGEIIEPERLDANPAARTCEAHMS